MKKYRKLSICISVLNAIGIVCLFYCAALYLSHDTYVVNPDAMLPMMNWERGGMMLTMGVMPMLIANTLGFLYILKKRNIYHQKIVVFHTKHFRSDFSFTLLDIFIACINFSL